MSLKQAVICFNVMLSTLWSEMSKRENIAITRVITWPNTKRNSVFSACSFGPENSPVYYSMLQEGMLSSPHVRNVQFSAFLSLLDHQGTWSIFSFSGSICYNILQLSKHLHIHSRAEVRPANNYHYHCTEWPPVQKYRRNLDTSVFKAINLSADA